VRRKSKTPGVDLSSSMLRMKERRRLTSGVEMLLRAPEGAGTEEKAEGYGGL